MTNLIYFYYNLNIIYYKYNKILDRRKYIIDSFMNNVITENIY